MPSPSHIGKELAIVLKQQSPAHDPEALALGALGWVLSAEDRAQRLLALTGRYSGCPARWPRQSRGAVGSDRFSWCA